MMGPVEVMIALIVIGLPIITILYMSHRFFRFREMKLEVESRLAAEKAAQYASRTMELEQRLEVLERIATDRPHALAREIDSLSIADQAHKKERI